MLMDDIAMHQSLRCSSQQQEHMLATSRAAASMEKPCSVIFLRDDKDDLCTPHNSNLFDVDLDLRCVPKNQIAAFTTSNIQLHGKILEREAAQKYGRSFIPTQGGSNGFEVLLISTKIFPRTTTTTCYQEEIADAWKSRLENLYGISVILGQVHSSDDDCSTIIALTTEKKNDDKSKGGTIGSTEYTFLKRKPINRNLTDDTSTTLSMKTGLSWTDYLYESERKRPKGSRHRGKRSKLSSKWRKQQWMASLHEPTKRNEGMEMVFFEKQKPQEIFYLEALPRVRSSSSQHFMA